MMMSLTEIIPYPLRILLCSPKLSEDGVVEWEGDIADGKGSLFDGEWKAHISHCPRLPGTMIDVLWFSKSGQNKSVGF